MVHKLKIYSVLAAEKVKDETPWWDLKAERKRAMEEILMLINGLMEILPTLIAIVFIFAMFATAYALIVIRDLEKRAVQSVGRLSLKQ